MTKRHITVAFTEESCAQQPPITAQCEPPELGTPEFLRGKPQDRGGQEGKDLWGWEIPSSPTLSPAQESPGQLQGCSGQRSIPAAAQSPRGVRRSKHNPRTLLLFGIHRGSEGGREGGIILVPN